MESEIFYNLNWPGYLASSVLLRMLNTELAAHRTKTGASK